MEYEITQEIVQIKPQTRILSAEELTKCRNVEIEPLRLGLKRTEPTGSQQEAEVLKKLHADLKQQISLPRIERLAGRTLAEWDALEGAARVTRKDGKFGNFGYSRDGKLYLEYFEALFLLELGRLQMEYNEQIISIEQAYLLLLGEQVSPKFNEYLVYSNLMRVGYILVKHQDRALQPAEATPQDCIWALLLQAVQNQPVAKHIQQSPHYNKIQNSMMDTEQKIKAQQQNSEELSLDHEAIELDFQRKIQKTAKRKTSETTTANKYKKRCRLELNTEEQLHAPLSYLDFLKSEPEFEQFREIFTKFEVIQLQPLSESDVPYRPLQIHFDLHLHNDGFKKSAPKAPNFRLILLHCDETFPTHAQIANCYHQQQYKVPLLIVSISDSKHIQAFLYFFT